MKIRTQLLLACFFLSVLPLTGVVFYSYRSSKHALEQAYHREARQLTAQMDRRLTAIRADLDQRLAGLSAIPLKEMKSNSPTHAGMVDNILMAMGEAAPLVDALEFVPTPPPVPPAPAARPRATTSATPAAVVAAAPAANEEPDEIDIDEDKNMESDVAITEPIVIDLPPVKYPKFEMPPDFHKRVAEISSLSVELGKSTLTEEEREAVKKALKEKQDQLNKEMDDKRETFHAAMEVAQQKREERERVLQAQREQRDAERERRRVERDQQKVHAGMTANIVAVPTPVPAPKPAPAARVIRVRSLTPEQKQLLKTKEKQATLLFGQKFNVPLHSAGEVVGQIRAQLSTDEVIKRVLGAANEETGEIPFAVDTDGNVYTRNTTDRATLDRIGVLDAIKQKKPLPRLPNWVIAMSFHKDSSLRIGVARPVGENLEELRQTAARNFGWGVGVIALALIGILPVAGHFTRDVKTVTDGAQRIAQGDLMTRLPVRSSKSEFGQLAIAFNQMAADLSQQQERLLEQERMSLDLERKSHELEEARRFQLSMLPKHVPEDARYDIAVFTQTATEVGGDYYDFHASPDGVLSVTIGDATGHGAKAGTMVTIIKTLFAGYNGTIEPCHFLRDAAERIKRMDLGRMAMALSLARFDRNRLTIASAGMPPVLIHRAATNTVDEIALEATPLGTLGVEYEQTHVAIGRGDTVLLLSDGFPELQTADGQQLGYSGAMQEFANAATAPGADEVIARLDAAARTWHGDQPPNDDITFVVVRCVA